MKTKTGYETNGNYIKFKSGFTGTWCVATESDTKHFKTEKEADTHIESILKQEFSEQVTVLDWFFDKIKSHFEKDGDMFESLVLTYSIAKSKLVDKMKLGEKQVESKFCKCKKPDIGVDSADLKYCMKCGKDCEDQTI